VIELHHLVGGRAGEVAGQLVHGALDAKLPLGAATHGGLVDARAATVHAHSGAHFGVNKSGADAARVLVGVLADENAVDHRAGSHEAQLRFGEGSETGADSRDAERQVRSRVNSASMSSSGMRSPLMSMGVVRRPPFTSFGVAIGNPPDGDSSAAITPASLIPTGREETYGPKFNFVQTPVARS